MEERYVNIKGVCFESRIRCEMKFKTWLLGFGGVRIASFTLQKGQQRAPTSTLTEKPDPEPNQQSTPLNEAHFPPRKPFSEEARLGTFVSS